MIVDSESEKSASEVELGVFCRWKVGKVGIKFFEVGSIFFR